MEGGGNMIKELRKKDRGFTLVELLVVIAIVAILAVVVLVAINPLETLRKTRNSRRLNDIGETKKSIDLAIAEGNGTVAPFILTDATGVRNSCTSPADWVRFEPTANIVLTKYLPALPRDPQNTASPVCYRFRPNATGDAYELSAALEKAGDSDNVIASDGGNDNAVTTGRYEVGTDLTLDTSSQ